MGNTAVEEKIEWEEKLLWDSQKDFIDPKPKNANRYERNKKAKQHSTKKTKLSHIAQARKKEEEKLPKSILIFKKNQLRALKEKRREA